MGHASLSGRVALITGAATGIGHVTAAVFAERGAKLVLSDVNVDGGEATAASIRDAGGEAVFVRADVSDGSDVQAMVAKAITQFGRLDCAVNNAGIDGRMALVHEQAEEDWDRVIAVNLRGVFLCMKHEIRPMLAQHGGAIVNVASVAGLQGYAMLSAYTASKHGVVGLTKSAALEYAKQGIRINALCPGPTRTGMTGMIEDIAPAHYDLLKRQVPLQRWADPDEMASVIEFLISPAASYVNGHAMVADGGAVVGTGLLLPASGERKAIPAEINT